MAVTYLEQAIARDPQFARAHAALAEAYGFILAWDAAADVAAYRRRSRQAAERALELDTSLPDAHTSLGAMLYRYEWDFAAGERAVRRAIELNPSYANALSVLAGMQEHRGDTEQAMVSIRRAQELDPMMPQTACMHAYILLHARRYTDALRQFEDVRQEHDFLCGEAAIESTYMLGRYGDALAAAKTFFERERNLEEAALLVRMAEDVIGARLRGQPPRSDAVRTVESEVRVEPLLLAKWYTWAGDHNAALRILERMVAQRHPTAIWITLPYFDPLRSDPRYRALAARMGIQ